MKLTKFDCLRHPGIWCCVFLFWVTGGLNARANNSGIVIETAQFIDNLNPFSYTVYPAELIIRFTTDRLIQQLCTGSHDPARGFVAIVQNDKSGVHAHYQPNASVFYVDLKPKRADINMKDIDYTIEIINKTPVNRYHEHQLRLKEDKILVQHPEKAAFGKAGAALTFPIIKSERISSKKVIKNTDDIDVYNKATTGCYSLSDLQQYAVRLEGRREQKIPVTFQVDILWENFARNLMSEHAHIGLSVSGDLLAKIPTDKYQLEETDDLNSFTYFGFNFKTINRSHNRLFKSTEFRKAFAFAVCSNTTIRELLVKFGDTMSHTFDNMRIMDEYPIDYMHVISGKVKRYVLANIQTDPIVLHILYRPNLVFSQDKIDLMVSALNKHFADAKIQFRTTSAPKLSEFQRKKTAGDFEIIFDTFIYGQNKLRYIEFMNPQNKEVNFLNCTLFSQHEINTYKKKVELRDQFLLKVNKKVPVFVLGTFRSLNAVSTRLTKRNPCKGKGRAISFTNIHEWRIMPKIQSKAP
jgi:hypothetical protein